MSEDIALVGPSPSGLRRTAESTLGLPREDGALEMSPVSYLDPESQTHVRPISKKAARKELKTERAIEGRTGESCHCQ